MGEWLRLQRGNRGQMLRWYPHVSSWEKFHVQTGSFQKSSQRAVLHYLPTKRYREEVQCIGDYEKHLMKIVRSLLNAIKDITQTCKQGNVEVPEDLKHNTHTGNNHSMSNKRVFLHQCRFLITLSSIWFIVICQLISTSDVSFFFLPVLAIHKSAINKELKANHGHKHEGNAELGVNWVEYHHRHVNQYFPQTSDPIFIELLD